MHEHQAYVPKRTDLGQGAPVLLLHGAVTDHRMWEPHAAILAERYRVIAPTLRYHGGQAWEAGWPPYGVPTHARDLVELLGSLDCGPVHLVAWSYACQVAFDAMVQAPGLFASMFAYEPGHPSWLEDPHDVQSYGAHAQASFGPIFEAVARGDHALALERLIDASGGSTGYFAAQSEAVRQGQLDNARSLPLLLGQEPARSLSRAALRATGVPLRVAYGSRTGAMYRLVGAALPGSVVIDGASHMWPQQDPRGFCDAVGAWLAR